MKKITLIAFLMLCLGSYAQTSFAIYTEDSNVGEGLQHLRFSNGQGFTLTEPTANPYEGTENAMLTFNGTSSYFHAIFIPRNSSNTSDIAIDIAAYNYYNVSFKTTSSTPFYIRMRGNGITAKVAIDPASNIYGFSNDGQWHFMSIPFTDFIPESSSFSLANITEIFVLRSNISSSIAGTDNDFEFDNIYVSTNEVMTTNNSLLPLEVKIYPNPTSNVLNIQAQEVIEAIEVYNLLGHKLIQRVANQNKTTLSIANLNTGIYLVKVIARGKTYTTKVVKN